LKKFSFIFSPPIPICLLTFKNKFFIIPLEKGVQTEVSP
jgi:hypothetical protein